MPRLVCVLLYHSYALGCGFRRITTVYESSGDMNPLRPSRMEQYGYRSEAPGLLVKALIVDEVKVQVRKLPRITFWF